MRCLRSVAVFAAVALPLVSPVLLHAQESPTAGMTPEQQTRFNAANASFGAGQWADALRQMKPLHEALPGNATLGKFTAESALNAGEPTYAIATLEPLEKAHPDDWQARSILAHAYAQDHRATDRDAELASLVAMHKDTVDAKFQRQTQIIAENISLGNGGKLSIYYSLVPWSRYKIYEMARVYDPQGKQIARITLESSDFDQPEWAKQHPAEAAAGKREFSLDAYTDQFTADGQHTETHFTYAFLDGQPGYDAARDRFIAIAEGKAKPMSSRNGLPVPK